VILEDVTLTKGIEITAHVRFKGGLNKTVTMPLAQNGWKKYMTAPAVIAEIDRLLNEHPDWEVARILNEQGFASGRQLPFSATIIAALRKRQNLKSRYDRLREAGMLDAAEMAQLMGTCTRTIYIWHKTGKLRGHLYNNEGAYLYERPGVGSALEDPDRRYRHRKPRG